jgi:ABC-type dipeptide/oligopeptide/nickel transport system permease component
VPELDVQRLVKPQLLAHHRHHLGVGSRRPVASEIGSRFMPTLWLTLASMSWAVLFGMAAVM